MRIGFVTCVQLGVDVLEEILEVGGAVDAIVTLEDNLGPQKSGRAYLDGMALRHNAELHKTANINDPLTIRWLTEQSLDWLLIIGWSQIANEQVLAVAREGSLGMHPTLLPEGRGRASIPWAILRGLSRTGVTLFRLDAGVDTGPIASQVEIPLHASETASSLYLSVAHAHRRLIRKSWPGIAAGTISFEPQDEARATVWSGRKPADGEISSGMTIAEADRLVRATTAPYPGARWSDEAGAKWILWSGDATGRDVPGLAVPLLDGTYVATVFQRIDGVHR